MLSIYNSDSFSDLVAVLPSGKKVFLHKAVLSAWVKKSKRSKLATKKKLDLRHEEWAGAADHLFRLVYSGGDETHLNFSDSLAGAAYTGSRALGLKSSLKRLVEHSLLERVSSASAEDFVSMVNAVHRGDRIFQRVVEASRARVGDEPSLVGRTPRVFSARLQGEVHDRATMEAALMGAIGMRDRCTVKTILKGIKSERLPGDALFPLCDLMKNSRVIRTTLQEYVRFNMHSIPETDLARLPLSVSGPALFAAVRQHKVEEATEAAPAVVQRVSILGADGNEVEAPEQLAARIVTGDYKARLTITAVRGSTLADHERFSASFSDGHPLLRASTVSVRVGDAWGYKAMSTERNTIPPGSMYQSFDTLVSIGPYEARFSTPVRVSKKASAFKEAAADPSSVLPCTLNVELVVPRTVFYRECHTDSVALTITLKK